MGKFKKQVVCWLPGDVKLAKQICKFEGVTQQEALSRLIRDWVQKNPRYSILLGRAKAHMDKDSNAFRET